MYTTISMGLASSLQKARVNGALRSQVRDKQLRQAFRPPFCFLFVHECHYGVTFPTYTLVTNSFVEDFLKKQKQNISTEGPIEFISF